MRPGRAAAAATAAALVTLPLTELRLKRISQPLTGRWRQLPVAPRGTTQLGVSFRPLQATALGLDPQTALQSLLAYPFPLIRLGAYWNRLEPRPGAFVPGELDRQLDAVEQAGKQVILCVGPVKAFGYPEFFVPAHHLDQPLREGTLIRPDEHSRLLEAGTEFITRVVERYRNRTSIIAWQVEHEAVDPLGMEHSWRLSEAFARREVEAVRAADPARPVMMNGFLPTSTPVRLQQWWRTRDQGDSLAVAQRLADIIGIDFYPRHALASAGPLGLYLAGSRAPWQRQRRERLLNQAAKTDAETGVTETGTAGSEGARAGQRIMIAEGQAEPWEAVTTPPSPARRAMYSCRPEDLIGNYNQCLRWTDRQAVTADGYLFWGAEYWLLRERQGDPSYLGAFRRVLECA
ncbi:MAG TPA: beta-galactosidase [Streptosporangiaceae bacterium]